MAESSKKQPRKSKLIPREYIDLDDADDENASTQMQVPGQSLLPKLRTAIDTESSIENSPSPVQFDIQVDVVTFYDDSMCDEVEMSEDTQIKSKSTEIIISDDAIRTEVEKISLSNNYSDRIIGAEVRNMWQKNNFHPHVPDYYEILIQNILGEWRMWNAQSKVRSTVLAYKCIICSVGWWHLNPFWDHIKIHKELNLRLESVQHECWVVAAQNQWYERMCSCQFEGNCPKCLKTFEEHNTFKTDSGFYYCSACNERFTTCFGLFVHEGLCARYHRIVFQRAIPTESMWRCNICDVTCLTQERYEAHRVNYHAVRSDSPIATPLLRKCVTCDMKYFICHLHACPKKTEKLRCKYCHRHFLNKQLLDIHMNNTKKDTNCKICKRYLNSQCMEVDHLIKQHVSSFVFMHKCQECLDHVLTTSESVLRKHKTMWHNAKEGGARRRNTTSKMIVPRSCVSSCWAENVSVGDMVIAKKPTLRPIQDKKDDPESLHEIIQRNKEQAIEKAKMDEMCNNLKNKLLKRACSNAASRSSVDGPDSETTHQKQKSEKDELDDALKGLMSEDDSNQNSVDEIKQEYYDDDDVLATDDDIMETQNSVDALLSSIVIKDEIKIEEQHWDHIVIDDSNDEDEDLQNVKIKKEVPDEIADQEDNTQESVSQEENSQEIIEQNKIVLKEDSPDAVEDEKDIKDYTNSNQKDHIESIKDRATEDHIESVKDEVDHTESVKDKITEDHIESIEDEVEYIESVKDKVMQDHIESVEDEVDYMKSVKDKVTEDRIDSVKDKVMQDHIESIDDEVDHMEIAEDEIDHIDSVKVKVTQDHIESVEDKVDHTESNKDEVDHKESVKDKVTQDHIESVQNEDTEIKVDLAIVKQEPKTNDDEDGVVKDNDISTEENKIQNIDIKTEVFVKEENEDYIEYDDDSENDITKEQDACLEELSKVFRATKNTSTIELSGISLSEDVHIKEELMDQEEYEDDIIMLYNDKPTFDVTDTVKTEDSKDNLTSDVFKDLNSETDMSRYEPEVKISPGPEPFKKVITQTGKEIIYQYKKTYHCNRCGFVGDHKSFSHHKKTTCKRKKQRNPSPRTEPPKEPWPKMKCSKCDTTFSTLKSYFNHFHKHGLRKGRCPQCSLDYFQVVERHLKSHIKKSFVRVQLLKNSTCITSRVNGVYQCQECHERVKFKKFFSHWEGHLRLPSEQGAEPPPAAPEPDEPPEKFASILSKENTKILLDQLVHTGTSNRDPDKKCVLCRREFSRRHDVKRHVIEHLWMDARARQPPLTCQLCAHPSHKADTYKSHMRNHASLPVFRCDMCDKCFSDSSNFAKHKKVHNLQVLSSCDLCKAKFHSRQGLEKHMEMHNKTKPIPCQNCDLIFYSQSAFNKHRRARHLKVPLLKICRICQQRFSTMRSFWNHMWEVHNERSIKADCPVCQQSFRKISDMRAHVRSEHTEDGDKLKERRTRRAHSTGKLVSVLAECRDTLVVYDNN